MLEGMLNDICGADLISSIFETLTIDWFAGGNVLNAVKSLHNMIKPIAIMLMFIYFMITLVEKLSSENFTWEQLWRQFALLLVSKYLIDHGFEILETLFDVGMAITADIGNKYDPQLADKTIDAAALIENFRKSMHMDNFFFSWLSDIIMVVFLLIPWLLSWVMRICVSIVCYSRVIEMFTRATFAPIAISDFFHSGLQGAGWRFLKNFLAVCLQGAAILVIAIIFSMLFKDLVFNDSNLFTFIGKYLAFYAAAVMLMFKSLSLTKEFLGTGG